MGGFDESDSTSEIPFDETPNRREKAAFAEDFARRMQHDRRGGITDQHPQNTSLDLGGRPLPSTGLSNPTRRELAGRLDDVEEKIDVVLNVLDENPRSTGRVLQDLIEGDASVREAAYALDWSPEKTRNVLHEIQREDAGGRRDE